MWYEILPTMAIIVGGIVTPPFCAYFMHKLIQNGNPYRRDIRTNPFDRGLLHRDLYYFKKPYKIQGLRNIPDEDTSDGNSSSGKNDDPCKC